ncbi:MAG: hypothetical protein WA231_20165 [Methylocella sp.]
MNVLYFLRKRTKFIRRFYENAGEPFHATIRKIDAGEAPFDAPPYDEDQDGEPPFMEEWDEANTALEMLGRSCISMLSASLQLYFKTWESEIGIVWEPGERERLFKKGFLPAYRKCFGDVLNLSWDDCKLDFEIIEQVVLARNRDQHPECISTMRLTHALKDLQKHPQPFFISDHEQKMFFDPDMAGISWMRPTLHVSSDTMVAAIKEVELLCEWMEERMLAAKYSMRG